MRNSSRGGNQDRADVEVHCLFVVRHLDAFDGAVHAALSAYNAGPGNAARWYEIAGGDIDAPVTINGSTLLGSLIRAGVNIDAAISVTGGMAGDIEATAGDLTAAISSPTDIDGNITIGGSTTAADRDALLRGRDLGRALRGTRLPRAACCR